MDKLNLTIDLDNLTEKEREKFFKLVEKSKKKSFNPFEKVRKDEKYYIIRDDYTIDYFYEDDNVVDKARFERANYFSDTEFAKRQALRELLNRKLMKFSYENGGADIKPKDSYTIYISNDDEFDVGHIAKPDILTPFFVSREVAQRAIEEVVEPFMKQHPDFKFWG